MGTLDPGHSGTAEQGGAAELLADELPDWLMPRASVAPAVCLRRIRGLCEQVPDVFEAMLLVCATHQGVPRANLAAALQRFHPALAASPVEDVLSMVNGLLNGGRDGLEAVQRSRKGAARRSGSMPFLRPD